jgi:hypothetical protein
MIETAARWSFLFSPVRWIGPTGFRARRGPMRGSGGIRHSLTTRRRVATSAQPGLRALIGLVRNNNLNRRAVALPYRSRKVPPLSTTRDTSFPSFIAFATIPSAVDLRSRTWVYPAFSSFQISSCSAALTCEEPVVLWSVGGRVDGVVLGCASAGNVIARKEATVQAANRLLMMHSPEYARAWDGSALSTHARQGGSSYRRFCSCDRSAFQAKTRAVDTNFPQDHQCHAANAAHRQSHSFRIGSPFVS